jgi:hypothetical protein
MSYEVMPPKPHVSRIKLTSKHILEVVEYILIGRKTPPRFRSAFQNGECDGKVQEETGRSR